MSEREGIAAWSKADYCEPGGPCEVECVDGCQHWCECPPGTPARLVVDAAFCNTCNLRVRPIDPHAACRGLDFLAYARLMNGTCPTCGTINAHDGTPRCKCLADLSPMGGGPNPWKERAQ